MTNFQNWREETQVQINLYVDDLVTEALKQKTYSAAKRWLQKQKPNLVGSFNATPEECFANVIASMYDEAIRKVTTMAMKQGVQHNASD